MPSVSHPSKCSHHLRTDCTSHPSYHPSLCGHVLSGALLSSMCTEVYCVPMRLDNVSPHLECILELQMLMAICALATVPSTPFTTPHYVVWLTTVQ
jgi:hypothetical protein